MRALTSGSEAGTGDSILMGGVVRLDAAIMKSCADSNENETEGDLPPNEIDQAAQWPTGASVIFPRSIVLTC